MTKHDLGRVPCFGPPHAGKACESRTKPGLGETPKPLLFGTHLGHIRRARAPVAVLLLLAIVVAGAAGLFAGIRWHQQLAHLVGFRIGDAAAVESTTQLWTCGMHPQVIQDHPGTCPICGMQLTPLKTGGGPTTTAPAPGTEPRTVRYWWDPMMNPPYISDKPGQSPMGMDLVPVYDDEIAAGKTVEIDPVVVQNMGVRVAAVREGPLHRTIRATGIVEDAQTNVSDISLRVSGFIEKLYTDSVGMQVKAGDPLMELYSPEMQVGAQELLTARRAKESLAPDADPQNAASAAALMSVAARKLEQWGLTSAQVEAIARMPTAPRTVTLTSPISGDVAEKNVVAGSSVQAGERLLRIVDRSRVWINARIFEQDLPFVQLGARAMARVDALPGTPGAPANVFDGEVSFINPRIDEMTRAATVRLVVDNPDRHLKPGMYATVTLEAEAIPRAVLAPREAIIDTGTRQIAFIALGEGRFEPRLVTMGLAADDGQVQILQGVAPGEQIVVSGQFLLDSESRLREGVEKYLDEKLLRTGSAPHPAGVTHDAERRATPWIPEVDAVFREYLSIAQRLGEIQSPDSGADPDQFIAAAESLVRASQGDAADMAKALADTARAMRGQRPDQQRERFKKVSDVAIELARHRPPSRQVAGTLFIAHCPMAPGDWLQVSDRIANPYYASTMKQCGEITGQIQTPGHPARDPRTENPRTEDAP